MVCEKSLKKLKDCPVVFLTGPTAVGKTDLAISLARELDAEIVNIDSVQLYQELDIGSAKPSTEQMNSVPHHLYSCISIENDFSVAEFIELAEKKIIELASRGKKVLFVGGSTLYIKALIYGLINVPIDLNLRKELEKKSIDELQQELKKLSPVLFDRIDHQNPRRLVRTLECLQIDPDYEDKLDEHAFSVARFPCIILIKNLAREFLYQRINDRTAQMIRQGIVEEVKQLISKYSLSRLREFQAMRSIGYQEVLDLFISQASFNNEDFTKLEDSIAQNTRRYAKRQLTFWRNEPLKRDWIKVIEADLATYLQDLSEKKVFYSEITETFSIFKSS